MKKIYCPRCGAEVEPEIEISGWSASPDGFCHCPECGCEVEHVDESEKVFAGALRFLAPEKKLDVLNETTRKTLNITGSISDEEVEMIVEEAKELARKYHPESCVQPENI